MYSLYGVALADGFAWGQFVIMGRSSVEFCADMVGSGANDESGVVFDPALSVHEL